MCGINGISTNNTKLVALMNEAIAHRGPDASAILNREGFAFGHNRLSIIDLSSQSDQPMISNDGRYTIVYNGEIYNFAELKEQLRDRYEFKTKGDTEVLLAAYSVWGEEMLKKLIGIFAFAIHDAKDNSILLVRDHMGIKPLYYIFENGTLTFSSELAGLMAVSRKKLNLEALGMYLSLQYVPSPQTFLDDVHKLQPGELLRYRDGHIERAYYAGHVFEKTQNQSDADEVLKEAVKRQLVSDREIGVFLSGGLDSSIVLHHAKEVVSEVKTFSVSFELEELTPENENKFNYDAQTAKKTASVYGTKHHTFTLTHAMIAERLEEVFAALDEPVANATAVSKYFLSEFVRAEGVVVAFGGDGGDEMFMGYPRHRVARMAETYQRIPRMFTNVFGNFDRRLHKLGTPMGASFHHALMANDTQLFSSVLKLNINPELVTERVFKNKYESLVANVYGAQAFAHVDRLTWLPDESLHTSDRSSMAHGIEYRVPFLDQAVVTYANSIPMYRHTSYFEGKKMLRRAYRSKLPPYLFEAPKKGWFSPSAKWLRNESVLSVVKNIMSDEYYAGFSDVVDWNQAHVLLEQHLTKEGYFLYPLWNLIQLQVWGRKHQVTVQ